VRLPRIYIDTSVVGGCLDAEFAEESHALLRMARDGSAILLISDVLVDELHQAPERVRNLLTALPPESLERIEATEEALELQDAYVAANVVTESSKRDAFHVALATLARADMIVSWNFKHIVHYEKIRGFNAVNYGAGYPMIAIHSPKEVV